MSNVRRCDNPACTNGPDGGPAISDTSNPASWLTATAAPISSGITPVNGDFDTTLCAASFLFGDTVNVTAKENQ